MEITNSGDGLADKSSLYSFRPLAKHILTIGEGLIQNQYAAVIELVKNAFDADSLDARVVFEKKDRNFILSIIDSGTGMSRSDVINKWLVPSTDAKEKHRVTPKGRKVQGRKGIGRYSASMLGNLFFMKTSDGNETTSLSLNWDDFKSDKYLDEIKFGIVSTPDNQSSGTTLSMVSSVDSDYCRYWTDDTIMQLKNELAKLLFPNRKKHDDSFSISLSFVNFYDDKEKNREDKIEPIGLIDFFDYRISGTIDSDGKANLLFENHKILNTTSESIVDNYGPTNCGKLEIDIRVFDRDNSSIDAFIERGKLNVTRSVAKDRLESICGIGVFRNEFRIRPLGDPEFDWLTLNQKRVQNPSFVIGSDQVCGSVKIEPEEISHLEEKSARDGLKDNEAYRNLKRLTYKAIVELEMRRFEFRRKVGSSFSPSANSERFHDLYNYDKLKNGVTSELRKSGLAEEKIQGITVIIDDDEKAKRKIIDELYSVMAIYQGQATLGKIVEVIIHEGRKPISFFANQIPNLHSFCDNFLKEPTEENRGYIYSITDGITDNSKSIAELFHRIDPLAARRRDEKENFNVLRTIEESVGVFKKELESQNFKVNINCPKDLMFVGWDSDFRVIWTNLIENSIFWINEKKSADKVISFNVLSDSKKFIIDYQDSGPGIDKSLIQSGIIFEPGFSTKTSVKGTGLGLAISGEAAMRNGLELVAEESNHGAHFVIRTKELQDA
jgi:hypothetical protein